jgi:putative FmdB family regulatory protein
VGSIAGEHIAMPTYDYQCEKCGFEFEREQRITEDPIKTCPECKSRKAKRLLSAPNFILKGGGWYADGYGSSGGSSKPSTSSDDGGSGGSGSDPDGGGPGAGKAAPKESSKESSSKSSSSSTSGSSDGKGSSGGSKAKKSAA